MNEQQMFNMLLQQAMNNPQLMSNPQAAQIVRTLQSGDPQAVQQLAQNYAQSLGVQNPQQIAQQAQQRASQMFRSG